MIRTRWPRGEQPADPVEREQRSGDLPMIAVTACTRACVMCDMTTDVMIILWLLSGKSESIVSCHQFEYRIG